MTLLVGTAAGMFALDDPSSPLISDTPIHHIARDADGWWAVDGKARIHHDGQAIATSST